MERRHATQSPQEVLVLCRERDVKAVDLRFTDLLGRLQRTTVPISRLNESSFEDGFGFDGSSIRGWESIDEADMILVPQPATAWIDPFARLETVVLSCTILDPITREERTRNPRNIARRAENYLLQTGVADTAYFGPETEFFVFDRVQYDQATNLGFYRVDIAGVDRFDSLGMPGPMDSPGGEMLGSATSQSSIAQDRMADLRSEIMQTLIECGIDVECHHHELGMSGQAGIDLRHDSLLSSADMLMSLKYIVKNVAQKYGKTATFMPKPILGGSGSGMHVNCSLWKSGEPLFAGTGYAGLSDIGLHAIGGLLRHAPALLAFTNPTANSYRRLAPGTDAPIHLSYTQRVRSAAVRIPMISPSPKSRRIEFRCPDPSCNPYLAYSAMLMAMIDGIQNKIHPGDPIEKDIQHLSQEDVAQLPQTPTNLESALSALEQDCDFLLRGDVFSEDALRTWIDYKRNFELAPLNLRPHPYEFCMYYDS